MIKKLLLLLCILLLSHTAEAWGVGREGRWNKLLNYSISNNGEWVAWSVSYGEKNDTLHIKNLKNQKAYNYAKTSPALFSENSKYIAFTLPSDRDSGKISYKTLLLDLNSGSVTEFYDIESFQFSKNGSSILLKESSKGEGMVLTIYDPQNERSKSLLNIKEYFLDDAGNYIAYTFSVAGGFTLEIMSLTTYAPCFIDNAKTAYEKLFWKGDSLTYLNKDLFLVCGLKRGKPILKKSPALKSDSTINPQHMFRWSKDGKKLFFGMRKEDEVVKDSVNVKIWHWQDEKVQSLREKQYYMDRMKSDLCLWKCDEENYLKLTDSTISRVLSISPDDSYLLAESDFAYRPHLREPHRDLFLIDTKNGKRIKLLENTILTPSFSSMGKYLIYFKDKNWFLYDIRDQKWTNVTNSTDDRFSDTSYDKPIDTPPSWGIAGWTKNDDNLLLYDEYDLWAVKTGNPKPIRLTDGREQRIRYRKHSVGNTSIEKGMLLDATGNDYKRGIFKLEYGKRPAMLRFNDEMILRINKAKNADRYLFATENNHCPPELYVSDGTFSDPHKLTETNRDSDSVQLRKSKLIYYKNSDGKSLRGALFYPVNFDPQKKYPMIVHIYEILSNKVNEFTFPSETEPYNVMNYVMNGYFVFQPDIVYTVNSPGESAADCVTAAVTTLLRECSAIDPEAIGLMGHSWGAYQTAFIITRTSLFKAAVAGAPLTNMISMYNSIYWESGRPNQEMFETSQGRFREPWWKIKENFINNSPIFGAENITTPLLMVFGEDDRAVNWSQGIEMYITMRRMRKNVIMLSYKDEGHTINSKDLTRRVMDYFGYYLKGESSPKWI